MLYTFVFSTLKSYLFRMGLVKFVEFIFKYPFVMGFFSCNSNICNRMSLRLLAIADVSHNYQLEITSYGDTQL